MKTFGARQRGFLNNREGQTDSTPIDKHYFTNFD